MLQVVSKNMLRTLLGVCCSAALVSMRQYSGGEAVPYEGEPPAVGGYAATRNNHEQHQHLAWTDYNVQQQRLLHTASNLPTVDDPVFLDSLREVSPTSMVPPTVG